MRLDRLAVCFGLASMLISCGGGGGSDSVAAASGSGSDSAAGGATSGGSATGGSTTGGTASGGGSTPPAAPTFAAAVLFAPADGASLGPILSPPVSIRIVGSGLENVELLPASGYSPVYARATISADKTSADFEIDWRTLPLGTNSFRVSAFSAPGGQGGSEIVAMAPRSWTVSGLPPFSASAPTAPAAGTSFGPGILHLEVVGEGLDIVNLWPPVESPIIATFVISPDKTRATLDIDTRRFVPADGSTAVLPFRISAFNEANLSKVARELVAMPDREWRFCLNPNPTCP